MNDNACQNNKSYLYRYVYVSKTLESQYISNGVFSMTTFSRILTSHGKKVLTFPINMIATI
jgi:hypothetical protein